MFFFAVWLGMENKQTPLDGWLQREGRKGGWLATQLGVTDAMVSKWRKGHVLPIAIYRREIERITGGSVPADAWK